MLIIVVALAVVCVAVTAYAGAVTLRLRASRDQVAQLEARLVEREQTPRTARSIKAAGTVVKTMVERANLVRDQGVGQMVWSSIEDFTRWATEDRKEIARIAGPDGAVTVFFSDIEGSTNLNNELGDQRWVKLLAAHDELVERYVDRCHGHVVKTQGDGHMVVFSTPDQALQAALGIQRALSGRGGQLGRAHVRLRIGLHTGTVIQKNSDFFGRNVALAARVAAKAAGGQVLASDQVAQAAGDEFSFVDPTSVELKGFAEPVLLWRAKAS